MSRKTVTLRGLAADMSAKRRSLEIAESSSSLGEPSYGSRYISSPDWLAKPLEEAKHGMFSYFLMKGMEGEADSNQDNKITSGELHEYVKENVIQQSSGSQTPELQGDADRVLVHFQ